MVFPAILNWLDGALFGYQTVANNGIAMPVRSALNFIGFGVVDDPELGTTDITGIPAGWLTATRTDFTSLGTIALTTDGPYTINGLTWTKENSANDASPMVINSNGLVITPAYSTNLSGSTRTLPCLYTSIVAMIPGIGLSSPIRGTVYVKTQNAAANYDGAIMVIENQTPVSFFETGHVFNGGAAATAYGQLSGTDGSGYNNTSFAAANVFRIEFPMGIGAGYAVISCATYSGGIPADSAFTPLFNVLCANTTATGTIAASIGTMAAWDVMIGAQRAGSATSLSIAIGEIVVEYKE